MSASVEAGPSPFALLFAPDRGMERHARVGRALRFFLFAWLCSILVGAATAYRVDARSSTLRKLEMSGQLQTMSDRQVADETHNAERVAEVASVAKGVVGAPLQLGSASSCAAGAHLVSARACQGECGGARRRDHPPSGRPRQPPRRRLCLSPRGAAARRRTARATNVGGYFTILRPSIDGPLAQAEQCCRLLLAVGGGDDGLRRGRGRANTEAARAPGTLIAWICYQLLTRVAMNG